MRKKLKIIMIVNLFVFFVFVQEPIFARYYDSIGKIIGKATIAEPIIKVEALQDTIIMEVNRKSNISQYNFVIKNYEIDSKNNKRINEIDFLYDIEIKNSTKNFPIRYELYDITTGMELLDGKDKIERY